MRVRGDDELAAAIVRNVVRCAERVEPLGAFDAELRFQRSGRVVDAGVDDAAVVRGGFQAEARVAFGDGNTEAGGCEFGGGGQAGDAAADYQSINGFHA